MDIDHNEIPAKLVEAGFSTKDRILLGLTTPDNYCLFIASRYFNTIDDHINFVQVSHRLKLNMEKFHYNPIFVNEETVKHFPNVQILHVYEDENEYLTGGRIFQYVDWRHHSFSEVLKIREENPRKNIEFKDVTFDEDDFKHLLETEGKELVDKGLITLVNDAAEYKKENIKSIDLEKLEREFVVKIDGIGGMCFNGCSSLKSITLPSSLKRIEHSCFDRCFSLKTLNIDMLNGETKTVNITAGKDKIDQIMATLRSLNLQPKK